LRELTLIIGEISKNPSNPKFNHFAFETLASLVKFVCVSQPSLVVNFENFLFTQFQVILQLEVAEFMPYVFQIMSQLLSLHSEPGIPVQYQQMLPPLLQPALWESHANIQALVNLMNAYVLKGVQPEQIAPILGITKKLVSSKLNDHFGFELLTGVFEHIPTAQLAQYTTPMFVVLLTRLMGNKTPQFTLGFINFLSFLFVLNKPGFEIDQVVTVIDSIQPGAKYLHLNVASLVE
jgi:exportin-2 (importin alpha re-exporter)